MEESRDYLAKIHDVNFRILSEIDRVCRENKIRYFLHGGTLLGAARHKDFIPWDDDVDIVFPRRDYERFLKCFPDSSDKPYYLINYKEHLKFHDYISRVVDQSVYIKNLKAQDEFYDGLYAHPGVDLFVFDDSSRRFKLQSLRLKLIYALSMGHRPGVDQSKYHGLNRIGAMLLPLIGKCISMKKLSAAYDAISRCSGDADYEDYYISNDQPNPPHWGRQYKKEWFLKPVFLPIRDKRFPCAKDYDAELRMMYGEYMELPPEDKRIPEHFAELEITVWEGTD